MPEQKIVITIDDDGAITAKTAGFKGESCLEALDDLLDLNGAVGEVKKTDEYHQLQAVKKRTSKPLKGGLNECSNQDDHPFVVETVLIKALAALGAEPLKVDASNIRSLKHNGGVQLGDIFTNRKDYNGIQHFRFEQGRWMLRHDSDEMNGHITASAMASREYISVQKFLTLLSKEYDVTYQDYLQELAEQERLRLEEQRKARVEATRLQAIEKAKSQGYSVKETRNSKGQIQLVLTRMV